MSSRRATWPEGRVGLASGGQGLPGVSFSLAEREAELPQLVLPSRAHLRARQGSKRTVFLASISFFYYPPDF